jgi:hypothetical protein
MLAYDGIHDSVSAEIVAFYHAATSLLDSNRRSLPKERVAVVTYNTCVLKLVNLLYHRYGAQEEGASYNRFATFHEQLPPVCEFVHADFAGLDKGGFAPMLTVENVSLVRRAANDGKHRHGARFEEHIPLYGAVMVRVLYRVAFGEEIPDPPGPPLVDSLPDEQFNKLVDSLRPLVAPYFTAEGMAVFDDFRGFLEAGVTDPVSLRCATSLAHWSAMAMAAMLAEPHVKELLGATLDEAEPILARWATRIVVDLGAFIRVEADLMRRRLRPSDTAAAGLSDVALFSMALAERFPEPGGETA